VVYEEGLCSFLEFQEMAWYGFKRYLGYFECSLSMILSVTCVVFMVIIQFGNMSDTSSDTEDSLSFSDEDLSSSPPPRVHMGKVMCWCKKCVGMILQHAHIAEEHLSNYGRHDGGFPGASSSNQV
jgi:hypothetical protein